MEKSYKLKTIIEVSEPVGRDSHRDLKDCKYILNVYGPSRYDPTKTAIVTQYLAVVNQFAKHMTAAHPCSYVYVVNNTNKTRKFKSFNKLTRRFLQRNDSIVEFDDICQDF